MNTLPIIDDYKSGYTLHMIAQKYNISIHRVLQILYKAATMSKRTIKSMQNLTGK